jgi:protein phosphatase
MPSSDRDVGLLEEPHALTEIAPEPLQKATNRQIDISVPADVEVGFGRSQTLYAIAARVAPTASFALLAGALYAPRPTLRYSRQGDWGENSVGSLLLKKVHERDYPMHQAELDAIGVPKPAALFWLTLEHGGQTSVPPEEWQAMLQVMCALARETAGVLYQPPGEVWRDFGDRSDKARASEGLLQKMATPKILEAAAQDDTGTIREHNEDRALVAQETGLCVVADGMGGQSSGAEAAEITVSTLEKCLAQKAHWRVCGPSWEQHRLVQAIKLASVRVAYASYSFGGSVTLNHKSLGSTVAAVLAVEGGVLIAHVGDSRVYRLRDGALTALTTDHTLIEESRHALPPDTSLETIAAWGHILTRALGMLDIPEVDARFEALLPGDLFLLCTDGLHTVLSKDEIAERLRRKQPLAVTCQELIKDANERGTPDNLAVALVRWG